MTEREEQVLKSFIKWHNESFPNYETLPDHLVTMYGEEVKQEINNL